MITGELFPVPLSATVCGLPVAVSAMLSVATSSPMAVGVNVTPIVQLALAAKVPVGLHAFVPLASAKLLLLVPVIEKLVKVTGPVPVLVTVTFCAGLVEFTGWEANVRLLGVTVTVPVAGPAPVPVKATVCGLPVTLSATFRVAVRVPTAVGVNRTLIVQLAPIARLPAPLHMVPEVGNGTAKSPAFVPVTVKPAKLIAAVPVFETVTLCGALVVPTVCDVNVKLVGAMTTGDATCPGIDCAMATFGRLGGVGLDAECVVSNKTTSKGEIM
jgi:hypothetical protein